jgi:hypothetical protein
VVATNVREQGEQLQRDGDHVLPTCRLREGADEHAQPITRFAGKAAWQDGANS